MLPPSSLSLSLSFLYHLSVRFVEHGAKLAGHVSRRSLVVNDDSSSSYQERKTRETRGRLRGRESSARCRTESKVEVEEREERRWGRRKENSCVPIPVRIKQRQIEDRDRLFMCGSIPVQTRR